MLKKVYNIIFIVLFMAIISLPLIKANWKSGVVSEDENRYLTDTPKLIENGRFNPAFTSDVESWFKDNMGFRKYLIDTNARLQYEVFGRMLKSLMGKFGEDERHSIWINKDAGNDTRLLLMCDSYINSFIVEDFAESFSEVWLVWGDYTKDLDKVIELYNPDIVIYECAERVDRSDAVVEFADKIK